MFMTLPTQTDRPETVWELTVPIIVNKDTKVSKVYLHDQIGAPFDYSELCFRLDEATEDETFILHLNTPGGALDTAIQIVSALKTTKATTIAKINGTAASAGSMIALTCDELEISDLSSLMIHNYSSSTGGKGNELKEQMKFYEKQIPHLYHKVYHKFLTPDEIEQVLEDKDKWLDAYEVRERWAALHSEAAA